jgi:hypothetical protein
MDFLKILTCFCSVLAVFVYHRFGGVSGTVYVFGVFALWGTTSIVVERLILKNAKVSIRNYVINSFGLAVASVSVTYILEMIH